MDRRESTGSCEPSQLDHEPNQRRQSVGGQTVQRLDSSQSNDDDYDWMVMMNHSEHPRTFPRRNPSGKRCWNYFSDDDDECHCYHWRIWDQRRHVDVVYYYDCCVDSGLSMQSTSRQSSCFFGSDSRVLQSQLLAACFLLAFWILQCWKDCSPDQENEPP